MVSVNKLNKMKCPIFNVGFWTFKDLEITDRIPLPCKIRVWELPAAISTDIIFVA